MKLVVMAKYKRQSFKNYTWYLILPELLIRFLSVRQLEENRRILGDFAGTSFLRNYNKVLKIGKRVKKVGVSCLLHLSPLVSNKKVWRVVEGAWKVSTERDFWLFMTRFWGEKSWSEAEYSVRLMFCFCFQAKKSKEK